jgi:LDH2 family malate/lactate/ureidoglycolate dehydrogenase
LDPIRFPYARLRSFVSAAFEAVGVLPDHAGITADRLLEADMRGRDGHGIIRVSLYVKRIQGGGYNLDPDITVVRQTPNSALVDGDNGIGQAVMTFATEVAIAKAQANGLAWAGTRHGNHAGAGGVYPALALKEGLIALYMAVGNANTMPPWGGVEPLLGTNPLAVAIPAGEEPPIQLDIATTVTSHGTVKVAAMAGESIPEGWMVDREGNPITDPRRADEGFLLPIGGHKGFGLNLVIGLLAGVLNGAAFGAEVIDHRTDPGSPTNSGQAILVMRPDLIMDSSQFRQAMDRHIRALRDSEAMPGHRIRMPGEEALRREEESRRLGVPVRPAILAQLQGLAEELGLEDGLDRE